MCHFKNLEFQNLKFGFFMFLFVNLLFSVDLRAEIDVWQDRLGFEFYGHSLTIQKVVPGKLMASLSPSCGGLKVSDTIIGVNGVYIQNTRKSFDKAMKKYNHSKSLNFELIVSRNVLIDPSQKDKREVRKIVLAKDPHSVCSKYSCQKVLGRRAEPKECFDISENIVKYP